MEENSYGHIVNQCIKHRLREYGLTNNQDARWLAIGVAYDVIRIMKTLSKVALNPPRTVDAEGFNPKGPKYL